jgi:pimeloyl-ACP methyl ester carboxylesterase
VHTLTLPEWDATLRFHDLPGTGRPIVFVHGLGCASSCDYPRVAAEPALAGRRFLLVDLLGSGFSDHPTRFSYSVDAHADIVARLVRGLEIEACDLFGHSMGGAIAIVTAARLEGTVSALVVAEPNLDPGGGTFSRAIAARSEAGYVAAGHDQQVREAVSSGNLVWAGSMQRSSPLAIHREACSLVSGSAPSWREILYRLPMRRTVLFGEASLPDPDVDLLPGRGVATAVVPRAGHSMMWENPAGLARAIAAATR